MFSERLRSAAHRFADVFSDIRIAMLREGCNFGIFAPIIALIDYLMDRFDALAKGKRPRRRRSAPAERPEPSSFEPDWVFQPDYQQKPDWPQTRALSCPKDFGWLLGAIPGGMHHHANALRALLDTPECAELLEADPAAHHRLKKLLHLLAIKEPEPKPAPPPYPPSPSPPQPQPTSTRTPWLPSFYKRLPST